MSISKQKIIAEIRRTAQENDGKPLGQRQFHTKTGIRQHDWRGKFWTAWGEALSEAGFTPNQKKQAYGEKYFFDSFIQLTRRYKRIPTSSHWRMFKRENPNFPGYHSMHRRFNGYANFLKKVDDYCRQHGDNNDITKLFESTRTQATNRDPEEPVVNERARIQGYVYMMKSGRRYKIGHSNDPSRRTREVGLLLPDPTERVHEIGTDDPNGIEAYWHKRFASKRVRDTEFFELDANDIAAFKRRRDYM